ncbi:MAG TPA: bifunctional oligoribonuclease/PAP phosphatase NrnA, partial [Limnochordia bacterium]
MEGAPRELVAALGQSQRYLISCHVEPDPDCIGSMLALAWALQRTGKEAICVSPDPIPATWRFLPLIDRVVGVDEVPDRWEVLVVVDCELARTGPVAAWRERAGAVILLDHHVSNPGDGDVVWVDPSAAATAEMVYHLIKAMGLEPDRDAATCLYAGLMADTGSFRYTNTTAEALEIGAELVRCGAAPSEIAAAVFDSRSWSYVKLLSQALQTLERGEDGRMAWISVTQAMLTAAGANPDDAKGIIQYARMIEGVELALSFREVGPRETRVSLRSKESVDVSALAAQFGGGGHVRAAGCTLHLPLDEAK